VEVDPQTEHTENSIGVDVPTTTTESLPSHGSVSFSEDVEPTTNPMSTVDRHRTNLLSALLEEFAKTRACEFLNSTTPGSEFTKSSPEVQPLAESVFQQLSQSLAITGVLPDSRDVIDNKQTRAAYLAGLESLALSNVQQQSLPLGSGRPQLPAAESQLAVSRVVNRQQGVLSPSLANLSLRSNPTQTLSPYSDLILSAPEPRRSHYESSFQQIRLLGKGGFGRVYHAYNIFDRREYAVKKIPLSPRLSQRYRESGHKELQNVLREVQALAQLEHNNVVRYHATWIEEPRTAQQTESANQPRKQSLTLQGRKLIADGATHSLPDRPRSRTPIRDHSDGIVFGSDSRAGTPIHGDDQVERGLVWSVNETEAEPSSARVSEIFTDGHARPNDTRDTIIDDSVYVLHVQMSVYPMTLAQYLAPATWSSKGGSAQATKKHCFHLVPALRILLGVLCGLQYVHAQGLLHRDIKPSNIFLSNLDIATAGLIPDGYHDVGTCGGCVRATPYFVNPRIGDFGLVAEMAGASEIGFSRPVQTTKPVGTEYYRPPTQTHTIDEKVDVFALGVILLELLWPCLTSTERMHVLRGVQRGNLPPGLAAKIDQEGHVPGTGDAVVRCISGMTAREPQRRWSCSQVKDQVESLLKGCDTNNNVSAADVDNGLADEMSRVKSIEEGATAPDIDEPGH
jgi:eukaryotic translation initiation factor 2-alpha kinase 3